MAITWVHEVVTTDPLGIGAKCSFVAETDFTCLFETSCLHNAFQVCMSKVADLEMAALLEGCQKQKAAIQVRLFTFIHK